MGFSYYLKLFEMDSSRRVISGVLEEQKEHCGGGG